eukprot:158047-Pyramimonas_sp.AAC.1
MWQFLSHGGHSASAAMQVRLPRVYISAYSNVDCLLVQCLPSPRERAHAPMRCVWYVDAPAHRSVEARRRLEASSRQHTQQACAD